MSVDRLGGYGGVEHSTLTSARWLAARGHRVDVLYRELVGDADALLPGIASATQVPTFDARLRQPVAGLRSVLPAVRAGLRRRPDVVYINRFQELPFALGVALASHTPIVCHLRYVGVHQGVAAKSRMVRRFVAVSGAMADIWAAAGVDRTHITVVPNGIDPDAFPAADPAARRAARRALGLPEDAFVAVYCGRIHPEKGVDLLIDAWEKLGLPENEARLVVLGLGADPTTGSYEAGLMARGVPGIEWLPARHDIASVLHAGDLAVAPSRHESFGRSIVEAMATGLPVVATRVEGIPETLAGFPRFLVDPEDAGALADGIVRTRAELQRDPSLSAACRGYVLDRFTVEASLRALESVLRESAGADRHTAARELLPVVHLLPAPAYDAVRAATHRLRHPGLAAAARDRSRRQAVVRALADEVAAADGDVLVVGGFALPDPRRWSGSHRVRSVGSDPHDRTLDVVADPAEPGAVPDLGCTLAVVASAACPPGGTADVARRLAEQVGTVLVVPSSPAEVPALQAALAAAGRVDVATGAGRPALLRLRPVA